MKKFFPFILLSVIILMNNCKPADQSSSAGSARFIPQSTVDSLIIKLAKNAGEAEKSRTVNGVGQCAALWTKQDGTIREFEDFCQKFYLSDTTRRRELFNRLASNWESLFGHFNMISLDLKRGMHLDIGPMLDVDEIFGGYEPGAHFNDDFFIFPGRSL